MYTANFSYQHGEQELNGYLAYIDDGKKRPAVLVVHDWTGRNEFACNKAKMLAEMGYVGFAVDMYGNGRVGNTTEEKIALMQPLLDDRLLLRARISSALDALITIAEVDDTRIAAIGFCFGGLCVLDLARTGASILGAVSFHGLLAAPDNLPSNKIKSKILALHGYDDPMVSPEQVNDFCQEMTKSSVDWQIHMYGNTKHGFSNPEAHDKVLGTIYNPSAERRSLQAMSNFLEELFVDN